MDGFDEAFMQKGDSILNDQTLKGGLGYDGFTYLKPEIVSGSTNFVLLAEESKRK